MRNVALVLSSGGARGLAHVGAIDELTSSGYRIRSIAGSSMGALVGGVYATGKLKEFKEWMMSIDKRKMFSLMDLSLSISHIVKGDKVIDALKSFVPDVNIEDLPIEYKAVATDWENGREVVYDKGSLFEAIRASISIPLFFNPVWREDMVLVDGGIINPLPLKQGSQMSGELLVAVNVSGSYWGGQMKLKQNIEKMKELRRSKPMSFIESLLPSGINVNYITLMQRMSCIMMQQIAAMSIQLYKPDIVVEIPTNRFSSFDFDKFVKISNYGQLKMRKALANYSCVSDL
ncbi:MAG: patatin-like phospholipase family protein [Bacteroidaceae bacterium]|nr:patatin-like phospholipase family protein [Bacteroidaceae bacterium]